MNKCTITKEQLCKEGLVLVLPHLVPFDSDIYTYDRLMIVKFYPGKYVKVNMSQGFWAGLFGKPNQMSLKLTTAEQFDTLMKFVRTLKSNK